jgi:6-phosphogluconolactonase
MISQRHSFANRHDLAFALAEAVGRALSATITRKGHATLAVSGGTTPALFFMHLARQPITWGKVTITLVDERQVPESSERSNAGLVKRHLLTEGAAQATFVALYDNTGAAAALELDVVVLGMGADGHTASFFPGGDTLAEAIDPTTDQSIMTISAPGSGEPRLTYTLPKLLQARHRFLHMEGEGKATVLAAVEAGTDTLAMPVRAVLQAKQATELYWCP